LIKPTDLGCSICPTAASSF